MNHKTAINRTSCLFISAILTAGLSALPGRASAQQPAAAPVISLSIPPPVNDFRPFHDPKAKEEVKPGEVTESTEPADPAQAPPGPNYKEEKATGDWGGKRTKWAEHGFDFNLSWTQFWQGAASGGIDHEIQYGGKFTAGVTIDGTKAGWIKNSIIKINTETRYLNSANADTGGGLPVNTALISPEGKGTAIIGVTDFNYTQLFIRDKGLNIYALSFGKFNTLDLVSEPALGGSGITKFFNINQAGPAIVGRTVPPVSNGVAFAWLKKGVPFFTFAILDPVDSSTRPGNFFNKGVTFVPGIILQSNFGKKGGHHAFSGTVTTRAFTPFDQIPQVILPIPTSPGTPKRGSWSLMYTMSQNLVQDAKNPAQAWGLFGQVAIADKSTNPISSSVTVGLGGVNLFKRRPQDRFGLAYGFVGYSSTLKDRLLPLIRVRDQHQVEAFYNWAIRPWLWLTGDLQVVRSLRESVGTAVVPGARLQIIF